MRANLLIYYILFIYSDRLKNGVKNTKKMIYSEFIIIHSEFISIHSEFIAIDSYINAIYYYINSIYVYMMLT